MYENNYPNNYEHTTTGQNMISQTNRSQGGSNSYSYGSNGSFSGANDGFYNERRTNPYRPEKKPANAHNSSSGTGKKLATGICCGLLFGIFAALGFNTIDFAADFVKARMGMDQTQGAATIVEESDEQTAGAQESQNGTEEKQETAEISGSQIIKTTVTDVTEVVKNVMPAVVSVNGRYVERMTFWGREYSQEGIGSGSGIIVGQNDTELLLATNYHVVEWAEELTVQFVNGDQAQAQVKGVDEDKDLAVIAVQLEDISSDAMDQIAIAKMGSSDDLTVGEPVIAIGNALGYGQSVTTGVVSALDRAIGAEVQSTSQNMDTEINTFIQTDAAINPGNSGGALLNINGEVIGINSSKIGDMRVEGMGYAIPISDAQPIIEELMEKETRLKVAEEDRGYLGITGVDVKSEYTQLYGAPKGVYVSTVTEGSGADKAGIIRGDIIVELNGEEITSMAELKNELQYYAAGTTVELKIMQAYPEGYRENTVKVTLGGQKSVQ